MKYHSAKQVIPISACSKHIKAFQSLHSLYEFNSLPFGLNSSGAKFCRFIGTVLRGILNKSAFAYVDDILIASSSFNQHVKDLQEVFDWLNQANLRLKLKKCHVARSKVKYLGHIVSSQGIKVDPAKVAPVTSFPRPTSTKGVRQYLGLVGFYGGI